MADHGDLARELLGLARDDAAAAKALLPIESIADAIIGFHAQQAVEKALKAALAMEGADFPFTHDLGLLAELCEASGIALPNDLQEVDRLSPYGVQIRYAGVASGTVDRETASRWAAMAIEWAEERGKCSRG